MTILIPVLGDQLSHGVALLRDIDRAQAVVLMMGVAKETTYVRHHQRKIALILSAMWDFAGELRAAGWMSTMCASMTPQTQAALREK